MPNIQMLLFPNEFRCFKPMATILFEPGVNLLVGSNGSGKSTVLASLCIHGGLKDAFWKKDYKLKEHSTMLMSQEQDQMRAFAHDFEYDSPRTTPALGMQGMLPGGMVTQLQFMKMSHGQSTLAIIQLLEKIDEKQKFIIILDEPDTGLSPAATKRLARCFKKLESQGSQVIAAVHNPWLIEEFANVWDMDKLAFRPSNEYLDEQRSFT